MMSCFACMLLDDGAGVLVVAQARKSRMPKMVDSRFILHPFMA
jgi:hypothetical protein